MRKVWFVVVVGLGLGCTQGGTGGSAGSTSSSSSGAAQSSSMAPTGPVSVQVLAINDFHGNLEPPAGGNGKIQVAPNMFVDAGGVAHLAAHLNALRAESVHNIVVSSGDLIGASPFISGAFHDEPTVEAMNLIGLALNGVGNHEFDRGATELLRMQNGGCHPVRGCTEGRTFDGAQFKFLAANVYTEGGAGPTLFPAYEVRDFDGISIGFIGMTLEGTPDIVNPEGVAGLFFADEVETANRAVDELQAQGVEAIIILLHEGGFTEGLYDACPGISGPIVDIAQGVSDAVDIILSAHTHQAYNCVIDGKLVTSAASFGRIITDVDIVLDRESRDIVEKTARNIIVTRDMADETLEAHVAVYRELSSSLADREVGRITQTLDRYPPMGGVISEMGAVIADAHQEISGAQIAFTNPGGVRASLNFAPAAGEPTTGIVRYAELFEVQPFGNDLVVMTLTGTQLKSLLEQQFGRDAQGNLVGTVLYPSRSLTYLVDANGSRGNVVPFDQIRIDGNPITASGRYRVAMNSYLASGGDEFTVFLDGTEVVTGQKDLDALITYFDLHSPISPPALNRIGAL